ncbi:MAG TPA: Uma2 family endonuclease [Mycobacteriales bacterium]|nr:Uma2 family endonuclease [Mycobacteriales bacterium]
MSTYDAVTVADLADYPLDAAVEIVEGTIYLTRPGGFDVADLDAIPDDGRRHELLDGVIVMSPSGRRKHQRAVTRLAHLLINAAPDHLEVLVAPLDVAAGPRSQVQPDVIVLPQDETERPVPPPLLAVEVLSPSNRRHDLVAKRNLYERAEIPSYWIIDPDEPSLTVLTHRDGALVQTAKAVSDETLVLDQPYEVSISPAALVR